MRGEQHTVHGGDGHIEELSGDGLAARAQTTNQALKGCVPTRVGHTPLTFGPSSVQGRPGRTSCVETRDSGPGLTPGRPSASDWSRPGGSGAPGLRTAHGAVGSKGRVGRQDLLQNCWILHQLRELCKPTPARRVRRRPATQPAAGCRPTMAMACGLDISCCSCWRMAAATPHHHRRLSEGEPCSTWHARTVELGAGGWGCRGRRRR
jgi:hypothetical protein